MIWVLICAIPVGWFAGVTIGWITSKQPFNWRIYLFPAESYWNWLDTNHPNWWRK